LMKNLSKLRIDGLPILIGVSRKSMIGQILHVSAHERVAGALALTALAFQQGARIFRTHDVLATKECIRICQAVAQAQ
jgi:dihydropteroate synthase